MITETEMVREEIIEEVIEYEYEVIGDQRKLVGERNIGKTITVKVPLLTLGYKVYEKKICYNYPIAL